MAIFASWIPSSAQLERKAAASNQVVDSIEVNLLRKYGHSTITNPFILQPAV
jgi:hypothetical protein